MAAIRARGFLAPERARLPELIRLVSGTDDPKVAWQRLAEERRIPQSWINDPSRRFVHDAGDKRRTGHPTRDPALAPHCGHPLTVMQCAQFAADVDGVVAAESAGRALARALEPWGATACDRVVWWTVPRAHYLYACTDTRPNVNYALLFAHNALHRAVERTMGDLPVSPFGHARRTAEVWREQAARGARVVGCGPSRGPVDAPRFADLPNPFDALAAIEACGYAGLEYLIDGRPGSAVLLVSPAVE